MSLSQRSKLTIGSKASAHVSSHGFANGQSPGFWFFWLRVFLTNDAVSGSLWFNLRWWSHYVLYFFFHRELVSIFSRKVLYTSLKFLARKLGRHLEKKQHCLSSSKIYFCFMSTSFKRQYKFLLVMCLSCAKGSEYLFYGLPSLS